MQRRIAVLAMVAASWAVCSGMCVAQGNRQVPSIEPTYADVAYGDHKQQRIDIYLADSSRPTPLVLFIHGGGFRAGSKRAVNPKPFLDAGISLAAIEYRFVQDAPLPAAHQDCCRALQFLRYHAEKYNFDKTRVGAFGGSAGAQLSMYLAFHDDLADPDAEDPIARESTRLICVATTGGQTSMDLNWWKNNIPGYDRPHRDVTEIFGRVSRERLREIVEDISALSLLSEDDPPIFMSYGMSPGAPIPQGARAQGWKVHHVNFGIALKKKADALGVEAYLQYPGAKTKYASQTAFLISKLKGE
ncbi:MAG: alpha/beta hydrolase [Planctomycetota bacterium]|nr:MAG: alpha/beta hydrolase [Planctomycetota bacterium]